MEAPLQPESGGDSQAPLWNSRFIAALSIALLLCIGVLLIRHFVAKSVPSDVHYQVHWIEQPDNRLPDMTDSQGWRVRIPPWVLNYILMPVLLLAFLALSQTKTKSKSQSNRVLFAAGFFGVGLSGSFSFLQNVNLAPVIVSARPTLGAGTNLIAVGEMTGPAKLKMGGSDKVHLKLWITNGTASTERMRLEDKKISAAQALLVATTFDTGETPSKIEKEFAASNPAEWVWLISPKEKKLGSQTILARVWLREETITNKPIELPYLECSLRVTDPIGIPAAVYYCMPFAGTIVMLLLGRVIEDRKSHGSAKKRHKKKGEQEKEKKDEDEEVQEPDEVDGTAGEGDATASADENKDGII